MLEQLGELQRMEAVANLAGGIAHELNNALTVVAGHAGAVLAASGRSADTGSARTAPRSRRRPATLRSSSSSCSRSDSGSSCSSSRST